MRSRTTSTCSTRSRSATTAGISSSTTSWWCGDGSPACAGCSPITASCSHRSRGPSWRTLTDNPDSAEAFKSVAERFDSAIGAVEDSREVLIGSFDVYMTRTAQRTNDIMKVLALATVLLLPGSVVAGLLGMNMIIPLPEDNPMSFWFVVSGVAIFAVSILVIARARRWL